MTFKSVLGIAALAFSLSATSLLAAEFGTSEEAKAMLDKAVAAVKADKAKALQQFAKGEGGFKDRDLYPLCAGPDGMFTAHPTLVGQDMKTLKDKVGKPIGTEMMSMAEEGKVKELSYMWPRPGADTTPVQKVTYVTKVGDQTCAVGYYK